jgi:uridine kinase
MNLQENIQRIKEMMGLITEEKKDKTIVLLDGTSSAGKSHTLKHLKAVPYYEANDPNQLVVIATDDFSGTGEGEGKEGEERRLKLDHPNIRQWAKENEDAGVVSGKYRKDGKDVPKNPYEKEYIEGTDPRLWYVAQEIKTGPWKKIVIDDIGKGVLQYLPGVKLKYILLHTPLHVLLKNVYERNERAKNDKNFKNDDRDIKMVLDQYSEKYEATKTKPDINEGDPTTGLTKSGITDLLHKNGVSYEHIDEFLNSINLTGKGDYYIKVRDSYMTPETQLINVDSERTVYLKDIDKVLK